MTGLVVHTRLRRFGLALAAVLAVGAATTFSQPADAHVWGGYGVGPGWGYYYAPAQYYPHHRYHPYWHGGWRWRHWCNWHPYRCRAW